MSLPAILHPEAEREMEEAVDWYEQQKPGLGSDFLAEVREVFRRIGSLPLLHGCVYKDVRQALVKRFPYKVLYRPAASQVDVIAVFHSRRDPSIWQARV